LIKIDDIACPACIAVTMLNVELRLIGEGVVSVWDKPLNVGQRLNPNRLTKVSSWILPLCSDPKNALAGKSD